MILSKDGIWFHFVSNKFTGRDKKDKRREVWFKAEKSPTVLPYLLASPVWAKVSLLWFFVLRIWENSIIYCSYGISITTYEQDQREISKEREGKRMHTATEKDKIPCGHRGWTSVSDFCLQPLARSSGISCLRSLCPQCKYPYFS